MNEKQLKLAPEHGPGGTGDISSLCTHYELFVSRNRTEEEWTFHRGNF